MAWEVRQYDFFSVVEQDFSCGLGFLLKPQGENKKDYRFSHSKEKFYTLYYQQNRFYNSEATSRNTSVEMKGTEGSAEGEDCCISRGG